MLRLYLIMSIILSIKLDISFLSTSLFLVIFDVCYRLIFMVIGQVAMTLTDDGHKTKPCKIICHLPSNCVCLNLLPQCSLLLFFTLLDIMIMVLRFFGIHFRLIIFKWIIKIPCISDWYHYIVICYKVLLYSKLWDGLEPSSSKYKKNNWHCETTITNGRWEQILQPCFYVHPIVAK